MSRFRSFRHARKSFNRSAPVFVARLSACAALIAAAYSTQGHAATVGFTSTGDGNLATPANWQSGALPAATDTASFGPTTPAALILQNTSLTLQGLLYTPGTSATTLTLSTTGAGSTALTLGNITNSSSTQQTISVSGANATLNVSGSNAIVSGNVQIVSNGTFAATNFSNGASAGSASIQSLNGATLTFNSASAGSATIATSGPQGAVYFTGASSAGTSHVTVNSSAVLGFEGNSNAASSTIINNGLAAFAGTSSAGTAAINNSGSLAISNASTLANATLQNTGTATFSGTASGGNSSIGNAGSVTFTGTASAGQALIGNSASGTLFFSQAADASQAQISNSGSIDLSGMQQTLSIGSLTGSGSVALGANTLTLGALGHEDLISGVISGTGGIDKTGSGALTLSGANLFTGPTSVLAGTLEIDGSIQSLVSVSAAAVLTGSGSTSSSVQVEALGALRPTGIFQIGGDLTISSQGVLQVAVTPSGQSSEVTVNGHATISGANLSVSESGVATDYVPGRSYTILTAQQGVAGTFAQVASSLPLLAPQVHYATDDVTLTFNQVAINGGGPATGINNIIGSVTGSSSSGSSSALVTGLDNLNSTSLAQALSSLGASSYGSMRRIELEDADDFPRAVVEHGFSAVASDGDQSPAWVELVAQRGADGSASSGEWQQSGLMGGVQVQRQENSTVNVAAQYLRSNMQLGSGNNGSSARFDIGLDATTSRGPLLLDGTLAYGQSSYDVHRFIAFGDYRQGPTANSGGDVFSARGEIALPVVWQGFALMPYAALQGTMANAYSFQEGGGAATDLYGDARRENIITNSLGLRARSNQAIESNSLGNASSYLSASVAWLHQSGCLDGQVQATLLADPTHTTFLSNASSIGHDRAAADLAVNTRWSSGWHLQLRLAAEAGREIHSVEAYAGAGLDF
jgi:autotransporter-associated beta strand protein